MFAYLLLHGGIVLSEHKCKTGLSFETLGFAANDSFKLLCSRMLQTCRLYLISHQVKLCVFYGNQFLPLG